MLFGFYHGPNHLNIILASRHFASMRSFPQAGCVFIFRGTRHIRSCLESKFSGVWHLSFTSLMLEVEAKLSNNFSGIIHLNNYVSSIFRTRPLKLFCAGGEVTKEKGKSLTVLRIREQWVAPRISQWAHFLLGKPLKVLKRNAEGMQLFWGPQVRFLRIWPLWGRNIPFCPRS